MKIAFFSPLNPIQSGISDYSEELLLAMASARVGDASPEIDLFIDRGYKPIASQVTTRFRVLPASAYNRTAASYGHTLYQMGNSPAHAYIYNAMLRHPGVVVMHEFVLHHLRVWMTLNGGRRKEYISTLERLYGSKGREAARRVMLGQFPEALFNYPLSEEAIDAASGIIVHSDYMAGLVRGVRQDVPLRVVPMGVPLPPLVPKAEARARLGLDANLFLVTSVGHLNPYKRVSATLRAFKALLMEVPDSLYLLIGSLSPNYDPSRQISMLGLGDRVKSTGYVSQDDFYLYLAASDVCLNLRYPTAGETSASLLRIMGAGVPVLVSRTGSFVELPDDAAGKIDVGGIEEELLLEYLLLLARRPDLRTAMSVAARRYVAEHHTLEQAAAGYLEFLLSLEQPPSHEQVDVTSVPISLPAPSGQVITPPIVLTAATPATPATHSLPSQLLPDYEPVSIVASAAASLGISSNDEPLLSYFAGAIDGMVLPKDVDGAL